jgi:peroxiredoxin
MTNAGSISLADLRNLNFLGLVRRFVRRKTLAAIPAGQAAPAIVLKDVDGRRVWVADALKKGPVLVAFFKVNCLTSQLTFPFLQRIHEMYGGSNFSMWGISQNHPRDTRLFIRKYGVKFPVLIDGKGYPVSNRYGLTNSPTLFLIMPGGRVHITCVGFSKADLEAICVEAARAIGKQPEPLFKEDDGVPLLKPG